jgi:hypothetical protein
MPEEEGRERKREGGWVGGGGLGTCHVLIDFIILGHVNEFIMIQYIKYTGVFMLERLCGHAVIRRKSDV